MQTLAQLRAAEALKAVTAWKGESAAMQKKLRSRCKELPFMIHANGLGQAVAFFASKGGKASKEDPDYKDYKDGHGLVLNALAGWLGSRLGCQPNGRALLQFLTQSDQKVYMAAQAEAMQAMEWVKKLATAYLAGEAE